jgi:ribosome maturation factor RimP
MVSTGDILKEKIKPLVEEEGLELVDLEFFEGGPQSVLRIYVDRAGGVTVDQCANLSRKIGDLLDIEDLITHRYLLEVSSPGLDRPLTSYADFKRKIGKKVKIFLKEKVDGKTELEGKIKNLEGENLFLLIEPAKAGSSEEKEEIIPLNKVTWAKIMLV